MAYDADIVVIGAGPAGLAAAVRARWLKTSAALPAEVALLDPAGFGGIAVMGTINLTGPSFGFPGKHLVSLLKRDVDRLEIPLLREAAVAVARDGDYWQVRTTVRTLRCLAVVVATGLRRLSREAELAESGALINLSGGYASAAARFKEWSDRHQGCRLVILGGEPLLSSLHIFRQYDGGRNLIQPLCEPRQRVLDYRPRQGGVALEVEEEGRRREVECEQVMVDYHSLELAPPAPAFLPPECRTPAGYCAFGPCGAREAPGLFAGGDCAGQPSLCLKALAQGSEAGFSAYRHVFHHKFGRDPRLFAFYVSPEFPPLDESDLPEIDPACHLPVGLTVQSRFPTGLPVNSLPYVKREVRALCRQDFEVLQREIGEKIATVRKR